MAGTRGRACCWSPGALAGLLFRVLVLVLLHSSIVLKSSRSPLWLLDSLWILLFNMEPRPEEEAALLCSVVGLAGLPVLPVSGTGPPVPPVSGTGTGMSVSGTGTGMSVSGTGTGMSELWRLHAAALRRGRAREAAERDRRRRRYLRRRRAFLLSSLTAVLSLLSACSRHVWVRDRTPGRTFWDRAQAFDDDEWKAQFRVSRGTFDYLLDRIGPVIRRRRTNYRAPIDPRRRLAITLWWLSRCGEYRSIAGLFGVGVATVCLIVRQVTAAVVERLYRRVVALPSGRRLDATMAAFRDRRYPQCAGAIGGTHIPIAPPRENPDHYINRRGWHSVVLQAVVDHDVCFTDVYAGWPGGTSSAAVLSSSDLYLKAEDRPDGYLFPRQKSIVCEGVEVPVHLIGDASFPLKPWLMKSYSPEQQLSPERRRFSSRLASARHVVPAAFTRLRGRWRCLLKKRDIDVSVMPRVVAACCVLHNVCERRGDAFLPEWNAEVSPPADCVRQPDAGHTQDGETDAGHTPDGETDAGDTYCTAEVIRDTVAYNMLTLLQY